MCHFQNYKNYYFDNKYKNYYYKLNKVFSKSKKKKKKKFFLKLKKKKKKNHILHTLFQHYT